MEDSFLKIKYDKLMFDIKYLEADLKYCNSILEKATPQFSAKCRIKIEEMGMSKYFFGDENRADQSTEKAPKEVKPKVSPSKAVDSLYKKVVTKTHPDKLLNLEGEELEKRRDLFAEATKAKDEDNLMKLHIIASELNIELPDLTFEDMISFEKISEELKKKIKHRKSTWMWTWVTSSSKRQEEMMEKYVGAMISDVEKKLKNNTEE